MADPTYRSKNFLAGSTTTSAVHSAPTGLADGDLMSVYLYKENTAAVTAPAGFGIGAEIVASDSSFKLVWYYKFASSESGTYTFSWTGSVYRVSCMVAYYNVLNTGGVPEDTDATYQANGSQNNQITCPSITTLTDRALVVAFGANYDYALTAASLSGYTVRERSDIMYIGDAIKTPTGATGALSITHASGSSQTAGITIALKPTVDAGQPRLLRGMCVPGLTQIRPGRIGY